MSLSFPCSSISCLFPCLLFSRSFHSFSFHCLRFKHGSFNSLPSFVFIPAIKCLAGSHYEPCGSACPASCQDPGSQGTCSEPCVEGCVCDNGLVLSGDKCVAFGECGCTDIDNNYRPVSWQINDSYFIVGSLFGDIFILLNQRSKK